MPESVPIVSVLVVSYNTRDLLRRCLRSLEDNVDRSQVEVVVVDNDSDDGSADLVASSFPDATLVRSATNLGFAAGVNEAARHARGRYLLLLNPDAQIRPGAVEALLDAAGRCSRAGLVGGRTFGPDGTVDRRSCWGLPTLWSLFCFGTGLSTAFRGSSAFDPESLGSWPRDTERTVGAVSGALLLIDHDLWRALGGFDEDYFMYSEDVDLAARALRFGRTSMITPTATATHVVGAASRSRGDKMALVMQGKSTYVRKNWTGPSRRFGLAMLWTGVGLRAAIERLMRRLRRREPMWETVWQSRHAWFAGYPDRGAIASTAARGVR